MSNKKTTDNCIPFDDISKHYDETRYFPQDKEIETFDSVIDIIRDHFETKNEQVLRFFDAGTGTGRLILPFINQFFKSIQNKNIGQYSTFEFYCLDISKSMLQIFENKLTKAQFIKKGNSFKKKEDEITIIVNLIEADLRTYQKKFDDPFFDIVFAHWIFHTIRDWQIALLNIFNISKNNSLLFTFEETSSLYYAIDNNLGKIGEENQDKFWKKYFEYRKNIYNYYGLIPLSANERIGTHVQDNKIYEWIKIIYNVPYNNNLAETTWETKYKYRYIIEKIIGEQLFSNMKLLNNGSVNPYPDISDNLLNDLELQKDLEDYFISTTLFKGNYFILGNKIDAALTMDIFKESISSRNPDDLFSIPNRAYDLFLDLLWKKINDDFIDGIKKQDVEVIVGVHFFDTKNDTDIQIIEDFRFYPKSIENKKAIKKIWININNSNESNSPFLISVIDNNNKNIIHIDKTRSKKLNDLARIANEQARIESIWKNPELNGIYELVLEKKLSHMSNENIYNFFQGLIDINRIYQSHNNYKYFNFFPNHLITPLGDNKNFGLLIITNRALNEKTINNINNFNKLLFKTLSKDIRLDLSVNVPVVVVKHKVRAYPDIRVNTQTKKETPDILIATSFATEFEQALKLAGVKKSVKEFRNLNFPKKIKGANKKLPQVYDISSPSFGNKKVWLFQSLQTGNNHFGIDYSLSNVLEYINGKPKLIIMGGVTAGMQENEQLKGQLLIADKFWRIKDINNISITDEDEISCDFEPLNIDLNNLINKYIGEIKNRYLTKYKQKIDIGSFITVNEVVNNYATKEKIKNVIKNKDSDSNLIGLEMEGFGFAKVCKENNINYLFCKGISDFAHHKDEISDFQKNVAKNAFDFIYYLIENMEF